MNPGLADAVASTDPTARIGTSEVTDQRESPARPRVIIADDDGLIRWSLTQALLRKGYEVLAVDSPARALEEMARGGVDIAIMDYVFPESSGIEVLRAIKTSTPKTHVIMITGYGSQQLERLARDIGAFDYFDKPFEVKAVVGAVACALATPERRRGPRA